MPENPFEKWVYEASLKRWHVVSLLASSAAVALLLWPFWESLYDTLGPEGLGGIAVLAQIAGGAAAVRYLPARAAQRELDLARTDGSFPRWPDPPSQPQPAIPPTDQYFTAGHERRLVYSPARSTLTLINGSKSVDVQGETYNKFRRMLLRVRLDYDLDVLQALSVMERVSQLVCLAQDEIEPAAQIFRNGEATELADKIISDMRRKGYPLSA